MKFLTSRKSLLITWLFSYVSIILVSFCAIIVISGVYEKTINEDTQEFNNYVFERVTSSVNDVLLNISNLHLTIIRNSRIDRLVSALDDDFYKSLQTYNVIEDLKSYNQYLVNTDSLFIYAKEKDIVLSHHGVLDSYTYFSVYFDQEKMSYEEWKDLLKNNKGERYTTMYCKEGVESLAFVFPISLQNNNGVGAILSNKKYLLKGIEKVEWKSLCDIFIYNTYGNLMIAEKRTEEDREIPATIADIEKYRGSKTNIYISNIPVDKDTWKVVTIVEKNAIFRKVLVIRFLVISVIVICLFVLAGLVLFFIKYNYHPIKIIMELFGVKEQKNEYEVLYEKINSMIEKNKELLDNTAKKDSELKSIALARLLKGTLPEREKSGYLPNLGGEYFAVLIFEIDDIRELFKEDKRMQDFERIRHLTFMIDNIFEELYSQQDMAVHTTQADNMIIGLLNAYDCVETEQIMAIAKKGIDFINKHFEISLSFALSEIHRGAGEIPKAYNQALETLEYKRVLYIEEPMCYSDMSSDPRGGYIFNIHKAQSVINSIKAGKAESAAAIIKSVFDSMESDKALALDYITFVILDILSTIAKAVNEIMPEAFSFNSTAEIYRSIRSGDKMSDIYDKIKSYLQEICGEINFGIKKTRVQERVAEIKRYVEENFTDPEINVSAIGYHFNLAPSYISKIFKEYMGISLVDYINKLRLDKAHELIVEGEFSMGSISKMVGFSNERTFYRIYKKYTMS